ncbi:hypothetical protein [Kordia sp.]|uniref:RHS repeat domain-containing protein n=1 Tax=Kordia sp. TaxID=1965332 RepID=UPI0025BE6E67|nr:hypothetical protein [Kordia sp.]MCH2195174.1 hypothetical protein [Kordia sp.]
MKTYFLSIISVFSFFIANAQSITKKAIAKNKVKTITKKEYYTNSSEGCNTSTTTYDSKGNTIKWDMKRLGFFFEYKYDEQDRKIELIRKSKSDSTDVYIMKTTYDEQGNILIDNGTEYQNFYDKKNHLIKSVKLDDDENTANNLLKTYQYDSSGNLIKEVHFENTKIVNTILYEYDTFCRLVEKREYDKSSIKYRNEEYAKYKKPIAYFLSNISYDELGRIKEEYSYFSDPCISIDDHYTFKNFYKLSDLLERTEVFFRDKHVSTTNYSYTFY